MSIKPLVIRCQSVGYRQGFIEITPNIHDGCINIEAWDVDPGVDLSDQVLGATSLSDESVTGNTELELSLEEAEQLSSYLSEHIAAMRSSSGDKP